MPAATSILLGGAALGGLAGAVAGSRGTPEQQVNTTGTSQMTAAPASPEELQMQKQSLAQYLQQLQLAGEYEQGIQVAQGMQQQARDAYGNILSGQAMQMTPQEQANVQALRDAMMAQGQTDVERSMQQGTMMANRSAASRGLRGQAQQQLQGDVMRAGAQQIGDITRQANQFAAQQAINLPYQRIGAQSPFVQQGMGLADMMRLQAMQNRQQAQSPFLMQLLNQNRMAQGVTNTSGSQITPGKEAPGLFSVEALMGGMTGAAGGLGMAGNVMGGIGSFNRGGIGGSGPQLNSSGGFGNQPYGPQTKPAWYEFWK